MAELRLRPTQAGPGALALDPCSGREALTGWEVSPKVTCALTEGSPGWEVKAAGAMQDRQGGAGQENV